MFSARGRKDGARNRKALLSQSGSSLLAGHFILARTDGLAFSFVPRGRHLGRCFCDLNLEFFRSSFTHTRIMASEEEIKDDIVQVDDKKEESTEKNDAATSDAKEESSDDKKPAEEEKEVKLYVGNLPDHCRRGALQELFEKYGKVSQCDIVKNYAFVVSLSLNDCLVKSNFKLSSQLWIHYLRLLAVACHSVLFIKYVKFGCLVHDIYPLMHFSHFHVTVER